MFYRIRATAKIIIIILLKPVFYCSKLQDMKKGASGTGRQILVECSPKICLTIREIGYWVMKFTFQKDPGLFFAGPNGLLELGFFFK